MKQIKVGLLEFKVIKVGLRPDYGNQGRLLM